MEPSNNCFVDQLLEPVTVLDLLPPVDDAPGLSRSNQFSNQQDLDAYFNLHDHGYSCRFISICQRNSWRPLQITRPMLSSIVSRHGIGSAFWDLPSSFYARCLDLEEAFCVPYTQSTQGPWIEISYTFHYPEFKERDGKWAIRQSGLYHRFNVETLQSLLVLFSPRPNSKAHGLMERRLLDRGHEGTGKGLFSLHEVLFSAYCPAWRRYIAAQEQEFLPIANSTFSSYINEPLRVGYDTLSTTISLECHFLKVTTMLMSVDRALGEALNLLESDPRVSLARAHDQTHVVERLGNLRRNCSAFLDTAVYLHRRAQTTAQLLANTLSFREQVITKEQNGSMIQLNKSAVFITTLTLIYAPASFIATFFGMNFFAMDQASNRIICTPMIGIYVASTLALTAATVVFYYWLLQHDGVLFWRLAPKVRFNRDWRSLARQLTAKDAGDELRSLSV